MMLNETIRNVRTKLGMTQEQLGEKIGVSAQAVSKWENDNALPDTALLPALADALSLTMDELFGRTAIREDDVVRSLYRYYAAQKDIPFSTIWELLFHAYMGTWGKYLGDDEIPQFARERRCQYWSDAGIAHAVYHEGREFFVAAPVPKGGFGDVLNDNGQIRAMLAALADADTYRAVRWLYGHGFDYRFLFPVLMRDAEIPAEAEDRVRENLEVLGLIRAIPIVVDGVRQVTYRYQEKFQYVMIWLMLYDAIHGKDYSYQQHWAKSPLCKK